ncbi:DMT family transporter [Streptomyces triculaminicus]|uniref:DMT family transporter n=1 Tax=Streptomyces triculaminicus TaxID=2816232 RepID=A0A939FQ71_9ACTN|nr:MULTISPECIES: DMT family transporter [Streptomyces]MBO0656416.1 DMT family transporter [Streptomyces triculaminicus]
MSTLVPAVLLCLVSAVCYAGAAIAQERVAATATGRADAAYAPLRRPGWWGAVALTGLGSALHVVALACGPLSLVQPLGALTIVFALPMAALFACRPVGPAGWRGALLATVGLAGLLSLTGPPRTESLAVGERPLLAAGVLAFAAAVALGARRLRRPVVRGVALATAAGAAFGMASVFTKAVAEDWAAHQAVPALLPPLGAIALLASAGMLLSQASYRDAGLAAPLATVTVVNPVVAAAVGVLALGEDFRFGTTGALLAATAGLLAASGVVALTLQDPGPAGGGREAVPAGGPGSGAATAELAPAVATAASRPGPRPRRGPAPASRASGAGATARVPGARSRARRPVPERSGTRQG